MEISSKTIIIFCFAFVCDETLAQPPGVGSPPPPKLPIPYPFVREADVAWSKRIWRVIDVREKINQPFYYPLQPTDERKALIDIIRNALSQGLLTAYSNPLFDDEFKTPLTKSEVEAIFVRWDSTNTVEDIESGETKIVPIKKEIGAEQTKQYLLKEDWFFDKQRSVLDVRIIGICPMVEDFTEAGEFRGYKRLFWIYYPEARPVFAKEEVFNRKNDAERRSFDEVFVKRQFNSYIYKESNVYDRTISEYKKGIDQLYESEKIKYDIFNWEHDLWHY